MTRVEQLIHEHLHLLDEAKKAAPYYPVSADNPFSTGPRQKDHPVLLKARKLIKLLAADPIFERRAPRPNHRPLECPAVRETEESLHERGVPKGKASELLRLIGIRG